MQKFIQTAQQIILAAKTAQQIILTAAVPVVWWVNRKRKASPHAILSVFYAIAYYVVVCNRKEWMYHPVMCYISKFVVILPVQIIHVVSNLYELHDLHKSFSHSSSSTVLFIAPYENRHAEYINKQHHKTGRSLFTQFAQQLSQQHF